VLPAQARLETISSIGLLMTFHLEVTPAARKRIAGLVAEKAVRVCWREGYGMAPSGRINPSDEFVEIDGLRFYVDAFSREHVDGAIIDYLETLETSGPKISIPSRALEPSPPCGGCKGCGTGGGCGSSGQSDR
jgi:Fe-S cluster assembly iron-binding protein IscA